MTPTDMSDLSSQPASRAVFFSYASEDSAAVQRIAEALQKAGVDVWFDRSALAGGDAWDAKIRRQIAGCTLFVPVVSASTQARLEGYFRIEWKLAAQRTHAMAEEKAFLLPVVIDDTRDAEAKVPAEFRAVQWTQLPGGEATCIFVERVQRLLAGDSGSGFATAERGEGSIAPAKSKSRGFPRWARIMSGVAALLAVMAFFGRNGVGREPAVAVAKPVASAEGLVALDKRKLAVLPFDNFSSEKEKFEYFADGMTEQMISRLSRVSGLTVKARNAIMKFKGRERDLSAIGRELGVGTILESSVRREGDQMRITVQLIDVQTLDHLWSKDFDETYDKVLAIQSNVAERVAAELKVELLGEEKKLIARRPTENAAAYDFFLRGKFYFTTGREATERSIELLEQAVALDGTFAEAYAELSLAYSNRAYFLDAGEKQWEAKAETTAARAIRLNPELPEAHLAQARVLWRPSNGFQHERAMAEIRRALVIRANMDEAHSFLGAICFHVGLIEQSLQEYRQVDEINPGNPTTKLELAVNELYHGRYAKALAMMEGNQTGFVRVFAEYRFASALFFAGRTADARARIDEALKKIRSDPKLKDEGGLLTATQALFMAGSGDKAQVEEKIQEAQTLGAGYGHFHHTAHVIASAYSLLNEPDPAMKWLRYAAENGYPNLTWFKLDPNLANLRKDPRFDALMVELQPRFERLKRLMEAPLTAGN